MNRTINFIHSGKIFEFNGEYYKYLPNTWNIFPDHFEINVFTNVVTVDNIDKKIYQKLDDRINFYDFYHKSSPSRSSIFLNWSRYRSKLEQHCDLKNDIFFLWYPGRKVSMAFAYLLRNCNLVIWVNSLYRRLFDLEQSRIKTVGKKFAKPIIFPAYNKFTSEIFKNNLIFYTGEVTFDTGNHINQVAITSCSQFNTQSDLIKKDFTEKLIYIGGKSQLKRLSDAVEFIEATDRDLQLTIMGIEDEKLNERDNINVVGKIYEQKQFYEILADHDMLLFPSIREKQGKVQLEAMSAGIVPICADSGGKHTTVKNYYNGLLYEPGSVEELNECVEFLYKNKDVYLNIQENGLEYVSELDVEKQVKMMANIIKNYHKHN